MVKQHKQHKQQQQQQRKSGKITGDFSSWANLEATFAGIAGDGKGIMGLFQDCIKADLAKAAEALAEVAEAQANLAGARADLAGAQADLAEIEAELAELDELDEIAN